MGRTSLAPIHWPQATRTFSTKMLHIHWRTCVVRQIPPFLLCLLALIVAPAALWAQDDPRPTTYLELPDTPEGDAYRDATRRGRIQNDLRYVDETGENLLADVDRPTAPRRDNGHYLPNGGNGPGVFIVVALFAVALFLFLKFGAGGTLLRSEPKNAKEKDAAPGEDWGLRPEDIPEGDLLSRIRNMPDRRAALILLLRYCLLRGAEATGTNFRRADTERDALGRIPGEWPLFANLRRLLMQTELVHYGGREIDDAAYDAALKDGAEILRAGGGNG